MSHWQDPMGVAFHYLAARRLQRLRTREQLLAHQQRRWQAMSERLANASPFYAGCRGLPLEHWPVMDKHQWMRHFDVLNTAGILLADAYSVAERAERTRDFRPMLGEVSVGLSTGTSGARGVFLANRSERRRWAGTLLAKLLPEGLLARERVALLLRAGNNLYDTVDGWRLRFHFFDLLQPFEAVLRQLEDYAPTILVGPAQALALVAKARQEGASRISPRRIVSAAEVLDPLDQALMERTWGARIEQIYQATEGFLGHTCEHGLIHLNEDCMVIECEWIDRERRRFVPVVTDLYRFTQPVVRYRLNDVLIARQTPCPCGSVHRAIERIEGREDDVVWLRARSSLQTVPVFADGLTRALLNAGPTIQDYQIDQIAADTLSVALSPAPDSQAQAALRDALASCCAKVGAGAPDIVFPQWADHPVMAKRRRVRGLQSLREGSHA